MYDGGGGIVLYVTKHLMMALGKMEVVYTCCIF